MRPLLNGGTFGRDDMENKHPSVRDVVEYGLDRISPDRTVSVPVRELVRLFKSFEELNAFFHQPMHYPNVEVVHAFLETRLTVGPTKLSPRRSTRHFRAFSLMMSCETLRPARSNIRSHSHIDRREHVRCP
jgi:hypothetical protein